METLHKQFMIVKQETNTSHVQEFGDTVSEDVGGAVYSRQLHYLKILR